jgi:omega-amidase
MQTVKSIFKVAVCQLKATENKLFNIKRALEMAEEAKLQGVDVISFGEMFTQPYNKELFPVYAEPVPKTSPALSSELLELIGGRPSGDKLAETYKENFLRLIAESPTPTYSFLKALSLQFDLLVIGGSLCEACDSNLYNTCYVFDKGEEIAKHRKVHLFDIDIPGQITFKESEVLSAGNSITVVRTRFATFGIGICYDIRFAEYAMALRKLGAEVLIYPSVFNLVTGPRHYVISGQARSLDTQCYTLLSSTARYEEKPEYMQSYGHSSIVDFNGKVLNSLSKEEGLLVSEIDLNTLRDARKALPYTSGQQRNDLYDLQLK